MALAQNLKNKLTATTLALGLTLAGAFGAAAPATAQDASANENVQHAALQASMQTITAEEAKELSKPQYEGGPGSVVLLVGEDFDQRAIHSLLVRFERKNIHAQVYAGGDTPQHLQLFIAGGALDMRIEDRIAETTLITLVEEMAGDYNLNIYLADNEENQLVADRS